MLEHARSAPTRGSAGSDGDSGAPLVGRSRRALGRSGRAEAAGHLPRGEGAGGHAGALLPGGPARRGALPARGADRPAGGRRGPPDAAPDRARRRLAVRLHRRGAPRSSDPPALPAGAARPGGDPARGRVARRGDRRARRAPQHRLGRPGPAEQGPAGARRPDRGEDARGGPRRSAARGRVGGGVDGLVPRLGARRANRVPRPARRGSVASTRDGSSACAARLAPRANARRHSRPRRRRRRRRPRRPRRPHPPTRGASRR